DIASGEADDEMAALPADRAEGGLRILSADRVVDHVGALAARERLDALAQVFTRIVDRLVGTVLAAQRELVFARGRRDHARAHRLADRDRRDAHATGRAEHKHGLAGSKFR